MTPYSPCWTMESIGLINTWTRCDGRRVVVLWDPWKQDRTTPERLAEIDRKYPCQHCVEKTL